MNPTSRVDARAVAVVGAGAAGALTAARLLDLGASVLLIDPSRTTGYGVAYGTPDLRHRLNVTAGRMSARAADPDDFCRFLRGIGERDDGFAPRGVFGRYLETHLAASVAGAREKAGLERLHDRVSGIVRTLDGVRIMLGSGQTRDARAVVLAVGAVPPAASWVPDGLAGSPRFVADPWAAGALDTVHGSTVLLVGTGLTAVDVAATLHKVHRQLYAVSRHGLLPQRHLDEPQAAVPPSPEVLAANSYAELRRAVLRHLAATRRTTGDWRPALDGLREHTPQLWARLSEADRLRFLADDAHLWSTHRHRMAPVTARRLACAAPLVSAATVHGATETHEGVDVLLSDGRRLRCDAVVNCTGPQGDTPSRTVVDALVATGVGTYDPLRLGLRSTPAGRLLGAGGNADVPVWVVGGLRRGELWESVAIPQLRGQAARAAADVVAACRPDHGDHPDHPGHPGRDDRGEATGPGARRQIIAGPSRARAAGPGAQHRTTPHSAAADGHEARPVRDGHGLPLRTTSGAAALFNAAVGRLLLLHDGAEALLVRALAADPRFALAHATRAVLAYESQGGRAGSAALNNLALARQSLDGSSDEREFSFVAAVTRYLAGGRSANAALLHHAAAFPRDALALRLAVPTIGLDGRAAVPETADIVAALEPEYGDDWFFRSQLAHVRQQQHRFDAAQRLATAALDAQPGSAIAVHALVHALHATGQHREVIAIVDRWLAEHGHHSSAGAHLAWHASIAELHDGDGDATARRWRQQLAPPHVTGQRSLIDGGSLLWRARMVGAGPRSGAREVLVGAPLGWIDEPPTPFVAAHAGFVLAAADDTRGLRRLREHVLRRPEPAFRDAVAPLVLALTHVLEQRWSPAADILGDLLADERRLASLGFSDAQAEVLDETVVHALTRAGRAGRAADRLAARLDHRPSFLDQRRIAALHSSAIADAA